MPDRHARPSFAVLAAAVAWSNGPKSRTHGPRTDPTRHRARIGPRLRSSLLAALASSRRERQAADLEAMRELVADYPEISTRHALLDACENVSQR